MSKQNGTVVTHKGKAMLERPKFSPGMLLQHEDLDLMTAYTQKLSRLMFRSLFGCGVICGLVVETKRECEKEYVVIQPGVGLDCSGYPVHVPQAQKLALDEQYASENKGPLWVVLCGTVMRCALRTSLCPAGEDEAPTVYTQERDGFEIRVLSGDKPAMCVCGCIEEYKGDCKDNDCRCVDPNHPCYKDHYEGKCNCQCDDCSECDCNCILLARLDVKPEQELKAELASLEAADNQKALPSLWKAQHSVRRFIRPVLMRDPMAKCKKQEDGAANESATVPEPEFIETGSTTTTRKRR